MVDALYWLKTPGESDGCTSTTPDGEKCARFDTFCESSDSITQSTEGVYAPEAGQWFDFQIKMLAENAVLTADDDYVPSSTDDSSTDDSSTDDASSTCAADYDQCGGQGWSGPTECCNSGTKCVKNGDYYSQCQP